MDTEYGYGDDDTAISDDIPECHLRRHAVEAKALLMKMKEKLLSLCEWKMKQRKRGLTISLQKAADVH